jgi:hypothetical protein
MNQHQEDMDYEFNSQFDQYDWARAEGFDTSCMEASPEEEAEYAARVAANPEPEVDFPF